jgi:hypothetical protein
MDNRSVITISRKWHSPEIKNTVNKKGIVLEMDIRDFELALLDEISFDHFITNSKFRKSLHTAIGNIISGIKDETQKSIIAINQDYEDEQRNQLSIPIGE